MDQSSPKPPTTHQRTLAVAHYPHRAATKPPEQTRSETLWDEFCATSLEHQPAAKKESVPLFHFVRWVPGHGPSAEEGLDFCVGSDVLILDFDNLHESDYARALAPFQGGARAVLTTWSYDGSYKYKRDKEGNIIPPDVAPKPGTYFQLRVMAPLSRTVTVPEWPRVWEHFAAPVMDLIDVSCRDIGHRFHAPSTRPDSRVPPIREVHQGPFIDVDAVLGASSQMPPRREQRQRNDDGAKGTTRRRTPTPSTPVTIEVATKIAKTLAASPQTAELAAALHAVLAGAEFAPSGKRHPTMYRLVACIVDNVPTADAESIGALFAASLHAMTTKRTAFDVVRMAEHALAKGDGRRMIIVGDDRHVVVDGAHGELSRVEGLYVQLGRLVRVETVRGLGGEPQTRIVTLPVERVREMIETVCTFRAPRGKHRELASCSAPSWLAEHLIQRTDFPGVPLLRGLATLPVLKDDGTIVAIRGYDPETGLYGIDEAPSLTLHPAPTQPPFRSTRAERSSWVT